MSDHKEFRAQVIQNLNPSKKYKKKWLHNTLKKLNIDSSLFVQYGINESLYNIIAEYLIGFPLIECDKQIAFTRIDSCTICNKGYLYLVVSFSNKGTTYFCNICYLCVNWITGNSTLISDSYDPNKIGKSKYRPYVQKNKLINREFKNILLWLGISDFTKFSNIYFENYD